MRTRNWQQLIDLATEICADALNMTKKQLANEILKGNKTLKNSVKMTIFTLLND